MDHGICPHCGRADAIKWLGQEVGGLRRDRFECGGCHAIWAGVRYVLSTLGGAR